MAGPAIAGVPIGAIISLIGMMFSLLSIAITIARFVVTYTIFFAIILLIGVQFVPFLERYHILDWLERILESSAVCEGLGPIGTAIPTRQIPFKWN